MDDAADAAPPARIAEDFAAPDGPAAPPPGKARGRDGVLLGVPVEVLISVGKARTMLSDLVKLRRDSVLALDSKIDDPVEIYIGDRLIARGELQEIDPETGQLGVRLTEVEDDAHEA